MADLKKKYYEYKLYCRKVGRDVGFDIVTTELSKLFARKEYYEKRGYMTTVKQRTVTEWEEMRNACIDDD